MKWIRVAGLVVVIVLAVVALQAAVAAQGPDGTGPLAEDSKVWIDPPSRSLEASRGDTFTATVRVDNAQDMVGYRVKMDWDNSVLKVTTVTDAGFLLEEPVFKDLNPSDPSQGSTFSYEVALLPPYEDGADGDGALVLIEMEAWGPGTSPLNLDGTKVEWVDKDGILHQPSVEDGTVDIEMDLELVFLPVVFRSYGP
jgi:hypothetical protein